MFGTSNNGRFVVPLLFMCMRRSCKTPPRTMLFFCVLTDSPMHAPGLEPLLEERVEELRHRLRIEAAVVEGAKNVIRLLQSARVPEKRALQEVSTLIGPAA
jgi:hypothetical protein